MIYRRRSSWVSNRNIASVLGAPTVHNQIARINASIETDPSLAIGTAKEMVETTCKTILADLGEEHATLAPRSHKLLDQAAPLPADLRVMCMVWRESFVVELGRDLGQRPSD
jgi:hypothetical protein